MVDYILSECGDANVRDSFRFRTQKATSRFRKAVEDGFLHFTSDEHRALFTSALSSSDYLPEEKLIILFWQLAYANTLFNEVTDNVFLRALYSGRTSIAKADVEGFLRHLKTQEPDEMPWSDSTISTTASKYLTVLKKFGLADGTNTKSIKATHISSSLFVYLVKFALTAYPEVQNLSNPAFRFSFLETPTIISRLKTIEFIPLWDIAQIGNDVTITLK